LKNYGEGFKEKEELLVCACVIVYYSNKWDFIFAGDWSNVCLLCNLLLYNILNLNESHGSWMGDTHLLNYLPKITTWPFKILQVASLFLFVHQMLVQGYELCLVISRDKVQINNNFPFPQFFIWLKNSSRLDFILICPS
jgi:hypothetical protein